MTPLLEALPSRAKYQHYLLRCYLGKRHATAGEGTALWLWTEQNRVAGSAFRMLADSRFTQVINTVFNHRIFHLSCPLSISPFAKWETRAKKEKRIAWLTCLLPGGSKMPNLGPPDRSDSRIEDRQDSGPLVSFSRRCAEGKQRMWRKLSKLQGAVVSS